MKRMEYDMINHICKTNHIYSTLSLSITSYLQIYDHVFHINIQIGLRKMSCLDILALSSPWTYCCRPMKSTGPVEKTLWLQVLDRYFRFDGGVCLSVRCWFFFSLFKCLFVFLDRISFLLLLLRFLFFVCVFLE